MKQALFCSLIFLSIALHAQTSGLPIDEATGRVTFKQTVSIYNTTKSELFTRAREWMDFYFKSDKSYIIVNDKASGSLTAGLHFNVSVPAANSSFDVQDPESSRNKKIDAGFWRFSFIFEAKEGVYKLKLTDFTHNERAYSSYTKTYNEVLCGGKIENDTAINNKYPANIWLDFKHQAEIRTKKLMNNLQNYIVEHKFKSPEW